MGLSKETLLAGVYLDSTSLCRSHFGPGSRHEIRAKFQLPSTYFRDGRLRCHGPSFIPLGNTSKYLYMRHVLKPEATKRNHQNETTETVTTTKTKSQKKRNRRNDQHEFSKPGVKVAWNGRRFSSLIAAEGRPRETSLNRDERGETSAVRRLE